MKDIIIAKKEDCRKIIYKRPEQIDQANLSILIDKKVNAEINRAIAIETELAGKIEENTTAITAEKEKRDYQFTKILEAFEGTASQEDVDTKLSKSGDKMTGGLTLTSYTSDGGSGAENSPSLMLKGGLGTSLVIYDASTEGSVIKKIGIGPLTITGGVNTIIDGTTIPRNAELVTTSSLNIKNGTGTKSLVQPETPSFTLKDITYDVDATGKAAVVLNGKSAATGSRSFASGSSTVASGEYAHSEGVNTLASGNQSHAEGNGTIASESSAHAEGYATQATKIAAHAEGFNTKATGQYSHAEGNNTEASGECAHAQGHSCGAYAENSFAAGESTKAYQKNQTVVGQFNDNTKTAEILFEVGNGESSSTKSNAFEVYKDGHAEVKTGMKIINGNLQIGNTTLTEQQLQKLLALLDD